MPEMPTMPFLSWWTLHGGKMSLHFYNLLEKRKRTGNFKQRNITLTMRTIGIQRSEKGVSKHERNFLNMLDFGLGLEG